MVDIISTHVYTVSAELPDNFGVPILGRHVKRSLALVHALVHDRTRRHQDLDHAQVSVVGGDVEWSPEVPVRHPRVRALLDQVLYHGQVTVGAGRVHGGLTGGADGVDVPAFGEEELDDLQVPVEGGHVNHA